MPIFVVARIASPRPVTFVLCQVMTCVSGASPALPLGWNQAGKPVLPHNHQSPRSYIMKRILALSVLSLSLITIATPAFAGSFQGRRGTTVQGTGAAYKNGSGGTTAAGKGTVAGFRGGSASGQGAVKTNGQGSATYQGSGSATTPQGQTYNGSVNGNASYSKTAGYAGSSTVTINGKTYQTTTQHGTTTVVDGTGSTVYQR
jgi:hypothetical protein